MKAKPDQPGQIPWFATITKIKNPEWDKGTHTVTGIAADPDEDAKVAKALKKYRKMVGKVLKPATEVLVFDREAVRAALKESRKNHTQRVKSVLP